MLSSYFYVLSLQSYYSNRSNNWHQFNIFRVEFRKRLFNSSDYHCRRFETLYLHVFVDDFAIFNHFMRIILFNDLILGNWTLQTFFPNRSLFLPIIMLRFQQFRVVFNPDSESSYTNLPLSAKIGHSQSAVLCLLVLEFVNKLYFCHEFGWKIGYKIVKKLWENCEKIVNYGQQLWFSPKI